MRREVVRGVEADVAETFAERARGLIGRAAPPEGRGLLLPRCRCVHTCFMAYPIDVTFLDSQNRVVKVSRGVRPWRMWVWGGWRAAKALETAARRGGPPDRSEHLPDSHDCDIIHSQQ